MIKTKNNLREGDRRIETKNYHNEKTERENDRMIKNKE